MIHIALILSNCRTYCYCKDFIISFLYVSKGMLAIFMFENFWLNFICDLNMGFLCKPKSVLGVWGQNCKLFLLSKRPTLNIGLNSVQMELSWIALYRKHISKYSLLFSRLIILYNFKRSEYGRGLSLSLNCRMRVYFLCILSTFVLY